MVGSTFVSVAQAAKALDVSERTVFRYIKKGYLRFVEEGEKRGLYAEDVEQLKRHKEEPLPIPVNKVVLAQMLSRISMLETQMNTVRRLLNLKYEPLKLTDPELCTLYRLALHHLNNNWEPHGEDMWADTLIRISAEDMMQLNRATQEKAPWKPFFFLAIAMHRDSYNKDLRDQFGAAVTHLESVASVYAQLRGDAPRNLANLVKSDGSVHKIIKQRLKARKRAPRAMFS